jgi:acyl carrier protein
MLDTHINPDIKEKLIGLIGPNSKLKLSDEVLQDDAKLKAVRFVEDMEADSLDIVELVMSVEQEFGIHIPDDEFSNIATFGEMVEYIEAKLKTDEKDGAPAENSTNSESK